MRTNINILRKITSIILTNRWKNGIKKVNQEYHKIYFTDNEYDDVLSNMANISPSFCSICDKLNSDNEKYSSFNWRINKKKDIEIFRTIREKCSLCKNTTLYRIIELKKKLPKNYW